MSEELPFETNQNKASFYLKIREYDAYFDLNNVNSDECTILKVAALYSSRESAINKDMFSVIKKIFIEVSSDDDFIAYVDDDEIICIEYPNGEIIKQTDTTTDVGMLDHIDLQLQ